MDKSKLEPEVATWAVIVGCLLAEVVFADAIHAFEWQISRAPLPLLRLSALLAVIGVTFWALKVISRHFISSAKTCWWEPGEEPNSSTLEWDEVYGLVEFNHEFDPLNVRTRVRWHWWSKTLVSQVVIYLIVFGVALTAIDAIRDPSPRPFLLKKSAPSVARSLSTDFGNPATYLALVVGLATIFFTFRQIRAKVRADSRQQWIIQAREHLGEVVALIDAHRDFLASNRDRQAEDVWNKLNPARLELELMLNPSEKDHRLLLYLIQRFARWRIPYLQPQDARVLVQSIAAAYSEVPGQNAEAQLPEKWKPILQGEDRAELVSYILRLAHVVLKREWERVKHTR